MNPRVQLIVDEFARHRHQFETFCRSLQDDELEQQVPDTPWTVKDYIAHLGPIDGLIVHNFQRFSGRDIAPAPDIPVTLPFDIDDWNAAAVEARRGASVEQLLAEAARHRAALIEALSALNDDHLDMLIPFGARRASGLPDAPVKLRSVLWAIALHDPGHTRDILRALPHRLDEPAIAEWLASADSMSIDPAIAARRA
jgi:hypothetical protein